MGLTREISELIVQRRKQILIHSIIYYEMYDRIVEDVMWDSWAMELEDLQKQYPDIAAKCIYSTAFAGFSGLSGINLPLDDEWGNWKARQLISKRNKDLDMRGAL